MNRIMYSKKYLYFVAEVKICIKWRYFKMYSVEDKATIVTSFTEAAASNIDVNMTDDIGGFMDKGAVDLVKDCIIKFQNNIITAVPEAVPVPAVSLYQSPLSTSGDGAIDIISLSLSNRINSVKKFKYTVRVTKNNIIQQLKDFFIPAYTELIISSMVESNLERVNDILGQAVEEAGVPYKVAFTSELGNEGKKLATLLDDEVVFVADEDRALSLDSLMIMRVPDEDEMITEDMIQNAYSALVSEIQECQTVEQLVANPGAFIRYVADISKHVKPSTIIKGICGKNVEKLTGNKDALAYYLRDNVFALVAKRSGNLEVVLSPFDLSTMRKVDVDVLKEISA